MGGLFQSSVDKRSNLFVSSDHFNTSDGVFRPTPSNELFKAAAARSTGIFSKQQRSRTSAFGYDERPSLSLAGGLFDGSHRGGELFDGGFADRTKQTEDGGLFDYSHFQAADGKSCAGRLTHTADASSALPDLPGAFPIEAYGFADKHRSHTAAERNFGTARHPSLTSAGPFLSDRSERALGGSSGGGRGVASAIASATTAPAKGVAVQNNFDAGVYGRGGGFHRGM